MKKAINHFAILILLTGLLSSCYTVKIAAPYQKNVTLAQEHELLPIKAKKTNWYVLFGSVPVSKNNTNDIIEDYRLNKIRVTTKITFGNYLINILMNALIPTTIVTSTTVVEGSFEDNNLSNSDN